MRRVKVRAPEGKGVEVARIAHGVGITTASLTTEKHIRADGEVLVKDVVDVSASTPKARAYVRALTDSPLFEREQYTVDVRGAKSLISADGAEAITVPFARPDSDVFEELWQFSHVTHSFVVRTVIAATILSYGVLTGHVVVIIAGLMFLPLVPALLAIGFGLAGRRLRLAVRGVTTVGLGLSLVIGTAAAIAALVGPPMLFTEFGGIWTNGAIATGVGIAAAYATLDDTGSKELVGLAAASQVALTAAWIGIRIVLGSGIEGGAHPFEKVASLGLNCAAITISAIVAYSVVGVRAKALPSDREAP